MGIISVRSPTTGSSYSVRIAGDAPTAEEQQRIDAYLAQQDAAFARTASQLFPSVAAPEMPEEAPPETDRTAFGRGYVREPFQTQRAFGVAEEALADTALGRFLGFSAEEARARQAAAEAELRRLEAEDPSIGFEDISGVGTAASFVGEQLGSEARDVAIQAGATATGAGIGAMFGGVGAAPGAAIGRGVGVGYTTAKAAPQMFAEAIEAQRETGEDVNIARALGATAVNLISEAVADYFVIGKLIPREAKSRVGAAVKGAIEAGTAEGGTEVFQQAVVRAQAGQDLTSPEALRDYAEALAAGMSVGGTIGGVGGLLSTPDRSADRELDDDIRELALEGSRRFRFAEETERQIEEDRQKAMAQAGIDPETALALPAPERPLGLPSPESVDTAPETAITDVEFENRSFDRAQYERVLQQIKADITSDKPINVAAIQQRVKTDIPGIKVSQVKDILTELQSRGFIAENPIPKKQKYIAMGALAPEVKTPDVSYRRQIDTATDFIKADQSRIERLNYDLQSAEAYGRDLDGNRVTPNQINAEIARVEQRIADNQSRIDSAQQRLQTLGQDMHVPRIERVGVPSGLKAVPVPEATADALRPRFEAQQQSIRGYKEQLGSIKKQIVKLNEQAKKRQLSSNELDRMQKLQQAQGEISTRLGEAQANLKTPEKILQEAKGEQFREQERQREIERKLAAAQARAAADQVQAQENQGVSPTSERFNAKQDAVFERLKKRLDGLGIKGVKLERGQKIEGAEGSFDPVTRVMTLAMGLYDPKLTEQQLFESLSEVMNHEVVHAVKAMNALKGKEASILEKAAGKTRYVKRTNEGNIKRSYTYLDRAKKLYADLNETQQKEEAVAEMFRDYVAGRLKVGGAPRAFLERIKKFFRSLVGANVDEGFTSVQDIFNNISTGRIGERIAPVAPAPAAAPAAQPSLSRVPTMSDLKSLVDAGASRQEIDNHPIVVNAIDEMVSRRQTVENPEYNTEAWHANRTYMIDNTPVVSTKQALKRFVRQAEELAYNELGIAPRPVARDRQLTIILGPPAAGKSTIANEIAVSKNAAILDSDEIKKSLPEYDRGLGAGAVHEESSDLAKRVQEMMIARGTNIVLPKVGENPASIRKTIDQYKKEGYDVAIVNMAVSAENAYRRMIGRFVSSGRIIPPAYVDFVGEKPSQTYRILRSERIANGYAEIDNNGGFGQPRPVTDVFGQNPLRNTRFDLQREGADRTVQIGQRDGQAGIVGDGTRGEARLGVKASAIVSTSAGMPVSPQVMLSRLPTLPMAPEGTRAHRLPSQLLMRGNGSAPIVRITQSYTPDNAAANNKAIQQILDQFPNAMLSEGEWAQAMQAALGGEYIPVPPMVGIQYAQSPEMMAEKLRKLTPKLKAGVDKGFEYVKQIRDIYNSGNADPRMTLDLFVWGILSRGAGPVQQEGAFIDIIDSAYPILEQATRRPLTDSDIDRWLINVSGSIPEGSPGKQVTMNVNAAANLVRAMSQLMPGSNQTVLGAVHDAMSDPNESAANIRQLFLSNTEGAGIDNKVLSFILLVGGKDDVLVMDRIQGRHLWDDGRFGGANIYDGIGKQKEGLNGIFRGPPGILTTRILENGLRQNVSRAYELIGRPEDASLGRFHWETWVIEGEQVVSHDTLAAVINESPIGQSVTEGKTDTFSSGMTYRRGEVSAVVEYPLSNGGIVYMKPERFKEFTQALAEDAGRAKPRTEEQINRSTGVFKEGKFKVTARADIPWFDRPEVDRNALDTMARKYENAKPDGSVLIRDEGARGSQDASQRGNSNLDRRYSRVQTKEARPEKNDTAGTSRVLERRPSFRGVAAEAIRQYGTRSRPVYEIQDADVFTQMIKRAKADLGNLGAQVTDYTEIGDSYDGKRLFLFDDGYSGFALNGDDIISVFSVPGQAPRGAVKLLMPIAVKQGGRRLDAFNTFLPQIYAGNGFRAVARLPFNREFAPEGWNYDFFSESFPQTNGEPDVVFMVYDPSNASPDTSVVIDDYDRGAVLQEEALLNNRTADAQERDFFAPRRLSIVPLDETIQANMTPEEVMEIEAPFVGVEIDPELPKQMYSRVPVAQAYMPVRAPRDMADGSPNPIYGSIMEGGRKLPVVLPKGSHVTYDNGIEAGNGLFHIQQRKHDLELFQNSKYQRVENAIYDLMRRWQTQGYGDGNDVISYPSGGNLALEWRENIAFGAPPLTLVLERGSDVRGAPVKDAYYVKTFYPVLEKKDRLTEQQRGRSLINSDRADSRRRFSRLYATTAQLAPQVQQKQLDLTYARSADFLAKGLGYVIPKGTATKFADGLLRKFQDNMLPVGRMIQELQARGLKITDAMDTYLREELFHGIVGEKITRREDTIYKAALDAVKGFNITAGMMDGLERASNTASGRGGNFVKQARESARSEKLALAEAYLYAKHAKERNAYIRTIDPSNDSGSGMTDAEADAILRWFSGLDVNNATAVRNLDAAVREIVADTNRVRVESGLIPSEFEQVLDEDGNLIDRPSYDFYVPLRGIFDPSAAENDGTTARVGGQRFGGKGRPDPRALGRFQYATDVLASIINQNQQSVARGERNKVGQSFLELLRSDPSMTKAYAEILPRTPTRRALVGKRVREITDFNAAQDPNIFVVKEDGKDVYVELIAPNIGAALKGDTGVGAGALGYIVRSMGQVNRYLANINTSYNPEFFITNFLRDLQTAGVNIQQFEGQGLSTQIVKDVRKALAGIKRSIRNKDDSSEWSQIYKDFVKAGGQNVTNQMSTVADQMENIRGLVGDIADQGARGQWNRVKNSFIGKGAGSLLSLVEDYNTVVENGIRVATYKALLDRGFTKERAAQAARNVTVNFAKGGEYKNFMNAFYLFYNASLQGSFALLNAALRSGRVRLLWAGVIATGVLQDQLNALLSDEDDDGLLEYDKIPDYVLEHNFILPDPFGLTDRSYIAIPMPYGLNMAHNIGRATSRAMRGGYDAGEATKTIIGTVADTINPLGGAESVANLAAPTIADPFLNVIQNVNFAGNPIYKEAFPGDRGPDSQRYWSTTNPSAIWVAQNINSLTGGTSAIPGFIDASPDVLNFWLDFATGGVGRFVQRTAELPIRVYEEGLGEEVLREVPFVRKVIGSVSSREDYSRYIDKRDDILLAGDELKEAIDNGDRDRALAARERFSEELRYLPRVRAIDNAIRQVNRQMNQVRDSRNLSDERRRAIMDLLDERKQMLIARGNEILRDY